MLENANMTSTDMPVVLFRYTTITGSTVTNRAPVSTYSVIICCCGVFVASIILVVFSTAASLIVVVVVVVFVVATDASIISKMCKRPVIVMMYFWMQPFLFSGWQECSKDMACSERCIKAYMKRYGKYCTGSREPTCQDYARIHNGGPRGCRHQSNATKESNLQSYWAAVSSHGNCWCKQNIVLVYCRYDDSTNKTWRHIVSANKHLALLLCEFFESNINGTNTASLCTHTNMHAHTSVLVWP